MNAAKTPTKLQTYPSAENIEYELHTNQRSSVFCGKITFDYRFLRHHFGIGSTADGKFLTIEPIGIIEGVRIIKTGPSHSVYYKDLVGLNWRLMPLYGSIIVSEKQSFKIDSHEFTLGWVRPKKSGKKSSSKTQQVSPNPLESNLSAFDDAERAKMSIGKKETQSQPALPSASRSSEQNKPNTLCFIEDELDFSKKSDIRQKKPEIKDKGKEVIDLEMPSQSAGKEKRLKRLDSLSADQQQQEKSSEKGSLEQKKDSNVIEIVDEEKLPSDQKEKRNQNNQMVIEAGDNSNTKCSTNTQTNTQVEEDSNKTEKRRRNFQRLDFEEEEQGGTEQEPLDEATKKVKTSNHVPERQMHMELGNQPQNPLSPEETSAVKKNFGGTRRKTLKIDDDDDTEAAGVRVGTQQQGQSTLEGEKNEPFEINNLKRDVSKPLSDNIDDSRKELQGNQGKQERLKRLKKFVQDKRDAVAAAKIMAEKPADVQQQTETCSICLSELSGERGKLEVCVHAFCFTCIIEWSKMTNQCPLCKKRFNKIMKYSADGTRLKTIPVKFKNQTNAAEWEEVVIDMECANECYVCHEGTNPEVLLICDMCEFHTCHTYCCNPPLQRIPDGEWICKYCQEEDQAAAQELIEPAGNNPYHLRFYRGNDQGGQSLLERLFEIVSEGEIEQFEEEKKQRSGSRQRQGSRARQREPVRRNTSTNRKKKRSSRTSRGPLLELDHGVTESEGELTPYTSDEEIDDDFSRKGSRTSKERSKSTPKKKNSKTPKKSKEKSSKKKNSGQKATRSRKYWAKKSV